MFCCVCKTTPTLSNRSPENIVLINPLADNDEAWQCDDDGIPDASPQATTGRVAGWLASFDKLLADPQGLEYFIVVMKKHHSEENVLFWQDVEKFKSISDKSKLKEAADRIYNTYLKNWASYQINIDWWIKNKIDDAISNPTTDMFNKAQNEIYQLMKLDCYPRFVKSEIAKDCLSAEEHHRPLPNIQ